MKNVLIWYRTNALGDGIAWFPYIEEYRIKHGLGKIYVWSCWHELFRETYPSVIWNPDLSEMSIFDEVIRLGLGFSHLERTKSKLRFPSYTSIQQYASEILGLEVFSEIKPRVHIKERYDKRKYKNVVSIGVHSTAQAKYWNNPNGWQEVIDFLNDEDYSVYSLDRYRIYGDGNNMMNDLPDGVIFEKERSIHEIISILSVSDFFIGLGSGLSWLAWALGIPVILISGFSHPVSEFQSNVFRVFNEDVCNSCFNKTKMAQINWDRCPSKYKKKEIFECTKSIDSSDVISEIKKIMPIKKWYTTDDSVPFLM